jgi:GAF domain-containing protein
VVDADATATLLMNSEHGTFTTAATAGDRSYAVQTVSSQTKVSFSIAHWVAAHKEPLALVSPANDYRFCAEIDALQNWPSRSLACIPMLAHDKVVGVIQVFNKREGPLFSDAELDLLSAVASQAALVIENTRLIEALAEKNRLLSTLTEAARKVASGPDLRSVLEEVLQATVSILGGNAASVLLLDKESGELCFEAALGDKGFLLRHLRLPAGRGIAGWVAKEKETVYVPDVSSDPRFDPSVSTLVGLEVTSILAAPLLIRKEAIGVLEVLNPAADEIEMKIALISCFADHAALAVNNSQLSQEAQARAAAPKTKPKPRSPRRRSAPS